MNLPFLKNKYKQVGVMIKERAPDSAEEQDVNDGEALEAAAQDIMNAIKSEDHRALAAAIRAAFQIIDSEPHPEGEPAEQGEQE